MDLLDPMHDFEFSVQHSAKDRQIITNKSGNQHFELSFYPG